MVDRRQIQGAYLFIALRLGKRKPFLVAEPYRKYSAEHPLKV